jgi:2-polyprenyl-3-methyl-5-hydroxy-6-metoxy-1,4-benzoquinol methylase
VSRLEQLERQYREHHANSRSPSLVYGGDERARVFQELVRGPGLRVLDLGCRAGALTRSYVDGNDVVGIDAAKLGIETRWADVEEPLDVDDEGFDVVVAGELLEHLREPERLVAEARRALRPRGLLVGSVPNAYRLKNRLRFLFGTPPERDPTHLHLFRPTDVRELLREFDDVDLRFVVGRLVPLNGRLFANDIVFSARKPG